MENKVDLNKAIEVVKEVVESIEAKFDEIVPSPDDDWGIDITGENRWLDYSIIYDKSIEGDHRYFLYEHAFDNMNGFIYEKELKDTKTFREIVVEFVKRLHTLELESLNDLLNEMEV